MRRLGQQRKGEPGVGRRFDKGRRLIVAAYEKDLACGIMSREQNGQVQAAHRSRDRETISEEGIRLLTFALPAARMRRISSDS